MVRFFSRRILTVLLLIWLLTAIIFALIAASPEGLERVLPVSGSGPFELARERSINNLDSSPAREYFVWIGEMLSGNLGTVGGTGSTGFPLITILGQRLAVSFILIGTSLIVAVSAGLIMGVYSALRPHSILSRLLNYLGILGVSIPDFALGILLLIVFAVHLQWLPSGGQQGLLFDETGLSMILDRLRHLILPVITLAAGYIAIFSEHVKTALSLTVREDYIRTARSKGLSEKVVILKHALRNSMIPILASLFSSLPFFLGGIVVVEHLFSWPGLGSFIYRNVLDRTGDFYVVLIITGLISFITLMGSLLADFLYALVDPRVRNPVEKTDKGIPLLNIFIVAGTGLFAVFFYFWILEPAYSFLGSGMVIGMAFAGFLTLIGIWVLPRRKEKKQPNSPGGSLTTWSQALPVFNWRLIIGFFRGLARPGVILGIIILISIMGGYFYTQSEGLMRVSDMPVDLENRLAPPSLENILGTDRIGRPVLTAVLINAGNTMSLVFYITLIGLLGGTVLGVLSGYLQGLFDRSLMAIFDLLSSIPSFFFVFLIMGAIGQEENIIIMAAAVVGLIELTRVIRARMLSIKEFQFVEAARSLGNSDLQILARHLLRNVFPLIWGQGLILFGRNMVLLSSLGYLRIIPSTTWGSMAGDAVRSSLYDWWVSLGPIIMIILVVFAVNIIGKGVLGNIDPLKK